LEEPRDPYPVALARGFLVRTGHPIDDLLPEIQRQCPILGYGVDVGVTTGLEKIWPFFPHVPQPVERVAAISGMPRAITEYGRYFAKHGLHEVSLFALDYRNRSVNLYFMRPPGTFSTTTIAGMLRELGLTVPGEETLQHCTLAVPIYFTFTWDSPRI